MKALLGRLQPSAPTMAHDMSLVQHLTTKLRCQKIVMGQAANTHGMCKLTVNVYSAAHTEVLKDSEVELTRSAYTPLRLTSSSCVPTSLT